MDPDPYAALGSFLTAFEAERLAAALAAGETTSQALQEVHATRRAEARRLLAEADLGQARLSLSVAVLRSIAGARGVQTAITPVWTMPGVEATIGRLTSEAQRLINDARMSVVCSSFNFTPNSRMWTALREATARPGVSVTVDLDGTRGRRRRSPGTWLGPRCTRRSLCRAGHSRWSATLGLSSSIARSRCSPARTSHTRRRTATSNWACWCRTPH
jgi:hypothetical protein